jgi:hypothetical protein
MKFYFLETETNTQEGKETKSGWGGDTVECKRGKQL